MAKETAAIEHPPHVNRLLRLIREGTPSHASRASILLGRYAASCCTGVQIATADKNSNSEDNGNTSIANPSLVIWDLIGRLVGGDGNTNTSHNTTSAAAAGGKNKRGSKRSKKCNKNRPTSGLFDTNWATRSNCAVALEHVAKCLPLEDRRHFFECESDEDENENAQDDQIPLWLNVNDLHKSINNTGANFKSEESNEDQSLDAINRQNQLDIVAERGRLLLSSSGEQFNDWDCNDEVSEYIREQEALHNLDASAVSESTENAKGKLQQSFLMKRVALQRQILAKRLGLGGIFSSPIVAVDNQMSIADEDLISGKQTKKKTSPKATPKEKGTKKKPKKRKRAADEFDDNKQQIPPSISIRALLVLESKRSAATYENDGITCNRVRRHRNPQTLLGSELAYRTFDPDWSVRHGALLGTLALLRAWKVYQSPCVSLSNDGKDGAKKNKKFGRWPQDILARCVCILSLDQFADFSGTDCTAGGGTDSDVDDVISSAIVAPVRESAAQIIAILLEAADKQTRQCTLDLLMQLYTRQYRLTQHAPSNIGWEIRHGVLLAWKYLCAMALFHTHRRTKLSQTSSLSSSDIACNIRPLSAGSRNFIETENAAPDDESLFNNIIMQSIQGLSDSSDDNRAVAAQVLRHSLLIDERLHNIDIAKECSKPLWDAIMTIREGLSSSASDLLHLLAELLSHDCTSFMSCLQNFLGHYPLGSILQKLADFIGDDSNLLRVSCFRALRLVAQPIVRATIDGDAATSKSDCNNSADCATILCQLLNRLFDTYFKVQYIFNEDKADDDDGQGRELFNGRKQAWCAILSAIQLLSESDTTTTVRIIIDDTFTSLTLRYFGISSQLTRINDKVGIGQVAIENAFRIKIASAQALAQFYEKVYHPSTLSEVIYSTLQSPWLCQCEAGCLLHICISSLSTSDQASVGCKYLPLLNTFEQTPISVILSNDSSSGAALQDTQVQTLCDNGLAMLFDSSKNCSAEVVVNMWEKIFSQKGILFGDLRKSSADLSLTKTSMQLSALLSGTLIACGARHLPPKVTPLIQALMTSLRNEECQSRRTETCRYTSKLVAILSDNPTHEKARIKLIENVCTIACCKDGSNSYGSSKASEHVIELLVSGMTASEKMKNHLFPIWRRLSPLLKKISQTDNMGDDLHDSIHMLHVISRAMSKDCSSFESVLNSFMIVSVGVACQCNEEELRTQASASINNFCRIDFCKSMDLVVPSLIPTLSNLQDAKGREGGCTLLLSILRDFEVFASPYVTTLLPVAMRLMTDRVAKCSQLAASSFAILVRIAPLAASYIANDDDTKEVPNNVIRHLILGKPLPPCVLPDNITSHLQKSGILLRPYQMEGISWLNFLTDVHLNGALCDDMGLGKTLQALIAVAITHNRGKASNPSSNSKSLVVCPSSVVGHWVSEIKKFFPGTEIFTSFDFMGNAKTRRGSWKEDIHKCNIVITSYSVLRSDINLLESVLWDWCILDEGHLLKNPKTATAKASRRLKARHKLILTGTPIQNNVHEIWATFDFLMPNFLGNESSFLKEFAKPITKSQSSDASASDINHGMECLKLLHQQVLPFVLRREKDQVIKELPPKIITDIPCLLSRQQCTMYQQTLNQSGMKEAIDLVDRSLLDTDDKLSDDISSPLKLGSSTFASLLQLRLICTHPILHSLYLSKEGKSSNLVKRGGKLFSFTRLDCSGKLSVLNDLLRHAGIVEAEITAADNDESGFLVGIDANNVSDDISSDLCFAETDTSYNEIDSPEMTAMNSSKCLIFAQFTQSLDIIERLLFEPHMPSLQYLRLDGRVPSNKRNTIVDQFNQDPNIKVLLLTTKVGGLGLNLTGADKVIFLEPDWNPFVDLQAMDRAHRIGQTKTVNVYRLITSGTIEEKIMKLQERKRATSEAVVNSDNSTMFSMGTDRLLDIFTFRGDSNMATSSSAAGDNLLSYLDSGKASEYSNLSVDGFIRGLT